MKILSIETSCDETSAAITKVNGGRFNILSNIVSSQVKIHARYGGIVPEVAARLHIEQIIPIIKKSLKDAKTTLDGVDFIAVCSGPGLISSLMVGVETAKSLAYAQRKPLIKINHLEGHLLSFLADADSTRRLRFPAIALIVSGGHTQLILVKDYLKYKLLGETRDDAAGEAFDKAAKILGLGYPGGPTISAEAEKTAESFDSVYPERSRGAKDDITLPRPMIHSNDFDFSFAGLKTAVLYGWNDLKKKLNQTQRLRAKGAMAREFQQAVIDVLIAKTFKAARKFNTKTIILGGGVAANNELRRQFVEKAKTKKLNLVMPPISLTGDNAAMIGIAAYYHIRKKDFISPFKLTANPEWELV